MPTIKINITNKRSESLIGLTSPKPIVPKVIKTK